MAARIANQPVSGSAASNVGILTQDNTSQYQSRTISSSTATQPSDWCTTLIDPPDFSFTEFLIKIPQDVNPELSFNLFSTNEVVTFMVNETNRYAEKVLNETIIRQRSRYKDWKPSDAKEIKKLLVCICIWELSSCLKLVITGLLITFL